MREISKEWLEFLREQYPVGSRIRLRELNDPYRKMEPGSMGTLVAIDDIGTFHVNWDNGSTLGLVVGEDSFSVQPPEAHTLKLYMPLNADLYEWDDYGNTYDEPSMLNGWDLKYYADSIDAALLKNRMPEEAESGIMHWYGEDDEVNRKVRSVVFTAEERNDQLWGVAECQVIGDLTPEELTTLKEYISGQASDGWGEGFEQREIKTNEGELYVHLWDFGNWSILTEEERFGQKYADGLPELCFSVLKSTGELICIKRGESGYYPSEWNTTDRAENERLADYSNEKLGVTASQRQAREICSMIGWDVPGADPRWYKQEQKQEQEMGGMSFG